MNSVDGAVLVAVVALVSWFAAGTFGEMEEGIAKVLELEFDGNWKGAVGLLSWLVAGAFGKIEEDVAKAPGPEVDGNWKGFFGAVEEAGGELLGLKSVDAAGVGTEGVAVFGVDSAGFENENGDEAVKGLGPEENIELELVGATGSFATVDDEGKGLLD